MGKETPSGVSMILDRNDFALRSRSSRRHDWGDEWLSDRFERAEQ